MNKERGATSWGPFIAKFIQSITTHQALTLCLALCSRLESWTPESLVWLEREGRSDHQSFMRSNGQGQENQCGKWHFRWGREQRPPKIQRHQLWLGQNTKVPGGSLDHFSVVALPSFHLPLHQEHIHSFILSTDIHWEPVTYQTRHISEIRR